jgi:hypothetical protein
MDLDVVRKIEEAFPGEIELTCWNREKEIPHDSGPSHGGNVV